MTRFADPDYWRTLGTLQRKLDSAKERCKVTAMTEKLLGYDESHDAYMDMYEELGETYLWISHDAPYID